MNSLIGTMARRLPGKQEVDSYLRRRYTGCEVPERYPRGHFHSPLPDYRYVREHAAALFSKDIELDPSININLERQLNLLEEFASYYPDLDWPEQPRPGCRYYVPNGWFGEGDAIVLHGMLRHFRPGKIIEVGSGFSSALMLDTDEKFLGGTIRFTFIDPNPGRLLSLLNDADRRRATVVKDIVQNVPPDAFDELGENDILFIDSSHVSKIGSDVNYLLFEILPRLRPGVVVHFHDIQWPFEYKQEWIMEGRAWNEAYVLRAFLQYNSAFEVLMFDSYVGHKYASLLKQRMPKYLNDTGGSLWLRKCRRTADD